MKYLDITLGYLSGTGIVYPDNYQEEIGNFSKDHLYYDDVNGTGKLMLAIEDVDFNTEMVRASVVDITENVAKQISEDNETRVEEILDEAKIRRIEIKANLNMTLTTEEQDAIDPTKPGSAFGVSEIFADRVEKLKNKETAKIAKKGSGGQA